MNLYHMGRLRLVGVYSHITDAEKNEKKNYHSDVGRNTFFERYELIFVATGEGEVHYQNVILRDAPGTVRFLPPRMSRDTYYVKALRKGTFKYIQIFFYTHAAMPDQAFCKDYSENARIGQLFSAIYDVWTKKNIGYYSRSVALFYEILYEMQITDERAIVSAHAQKIQAGVDYLHDHYTDTNFEYTKLAEVSDISYSYFKKLFLEIYGISPSEYLANLRMKRARELLQLSCASVAEIAAACGYSDIYYFSKVFKQKNQCSPREYRKLHP